MTVATYIAARHPLWRQAEIHLRIVSGFDPGLTITLVPRSTKVLLGFTLIEVSYKPRDLYDEGRKLLNSVINFASIMRDVVIFPMEGSFAYDDAATVSLLKQLMPWLNQSATSFKMSDMGGLATERFDKDSGTKLWSVEYDAEAGSRYQARSWVGSSWIDIERPEILFHELVHIDDAADPSLLEELKVGPVLESRAIIQANVYRRQRRPGLDLAEQRSPVDMRIQYIPSRNP